MRRAHHSRVQLIGVPLVLVACRRTSTAVRLAISGSIVRSASPACAPQAAQPPRVDEHELPRAARREVLMAQARPETERHTTGRTSVEGAERCGAGMPARGQRNLRCASASAAASPAQAPSCAQGTAGSGNPEGRHEHKYARTTAETRATPPPQTHPHTRLLTPYHRHTLKRTRTHSHENACALTNAQRAHAADRTGAAASHERRSERPEGVRGESRRAHLETTAPPAPTRHCTAVQDGAAAARGRRARRGRCK